MNSYIFPSEPCEKVHKSRGPRLEVLYIQTRSRGLKFESWAVYSFSAYTNLFNLVIDIQI
jgi:hypothetical protein